jgi:hypothetical protein
MAESPLKGGLSAFKGRLAGLGSGGAGRGGSGQDVVQCRRESLALLLQLAFDV